MFSYLNDQASEVGELQGTKQSGKNEPYRLSGVHSSTPAQQECGCYVCTLSATIHIQIATVYMYIDS